MKHLIPLAAMCMGVLCHARETPKLHDVPMFGKTSVTPAPTPVNYERKLVAAVLVLEAGGEGTRGMEAVMHVVDNRCRDRRLTPQKVVSQRGQFTTMKRGAASAISRANETPEVYAKALAVYDRWKNGKLGRDETLGALYFESFRRTPRAWRKFRITAHIGGHKFYRP